MHIKLIFHKTREIAKIVKNHGKKAKLIITMNATGSIIKQIADKDTILICTTYTEGIDKHVKELHIHPFLHVKIYLTETHIIFSTANASTGNMIEASLIMDKKGKEAGETEAKIWEIARSLMTSPFDPLTSLAYL